MWRAGVVRARDVVVHSRLRCLHSTEICQGNRPDGQHCELFSKANGTGIEMLLGDTKCGSLGPVSSAQGFGHTDSTDDAQPLMDIDKH